jgi:hypothetical protein
VRLESSPEGFPKLLGPLPEGAEIVDGPGEPLDVIVLFVTSESDLAGRFIELTEMLTSAGGLWVAWPKKSSKIENDLSFEAVQGIGLRAGLVDNKSCAIDADWQGLRFVCRKKDRPQSR